MAASILFYLAPGQRPIGYVDGSPFEPPERMSTGIYELPEGIKNAIPYVARTSQDIPGAKGSRWILRVKTRLGEFPGVAKYTPIPPVTLIPPRTGNSGKTEGFTVTRPGLYILMGEAASGKTQLARLIYKSGGPRAAFVNISEPEANSLQGSLSMYSCVISAIAAVKEDIIVIDSLMGLTLYGQQLVSGGFPRDFAHEARAIDMWAAYHGKVVVAVLNPMTTKNADDLAPFLEGACAGVFKTERTDATVRGSAVELQITLLYGVRDSGRRGVSRGENRVSALTAPIEPPPNSESIISVISEMMDPSNRKINTEDLADLTAEGTQLNEEPA